MNLHPTEWKLGALVDTLIVVWHFVAAYFTHQKQLRIRVRAHCTHPTTHYTLVLVALVMSTNNLATNAPQIILNTVIQECKWCRPLSLQLGHLLCAACSPS